MRAESDKICAEYGLSVIENPGRGKSYAEWKAEQEGRPTIRGQIKDELDEIIKASYTYKDFWRLLKQRGYDVKRDVKYVALKPAYSQRYIRLKSLGENYSEESIQRRIAMARNGIRVLDKPTSDYNAWLNGQTCGYSYGELVDIANNAIWQYRDMYLRPDFYINNIERVQTIIAPVIEDFKSGKITYTEAEFNARIAIYQSVNPAFNPDVEFAKDTCYRDIPSVDGSLFIIARKLLLK